MDTTRPFPHYPELRSLTWEKCFAMDRERIISDFIEPLTKVHKSTHRANVPRMAEGLRRMTSLGTRGRSVNATMISTTLDSEGYCSKVQLLPKDVVISPELRAVLDKRQKEGYGRPARFPWQPTGASTLLFCLSVFDLLSACMSEAAYVRRDHATFLTRTKDNYFAMLAALHKYWIYRIPPPHLRKEDYRPRMTSIYCFRDTIVLGSSLPVIHGFPDGKGLLQEARLNDLQARGQKLGGLGRALDLSKSFLFQYGFCAETWLFAMLCGE